MWIEQRTKMVGNRNSHHNFFTVFSDSAMEDITFRNVYTTNIYDSEKDCIAEYQKMKDFSIDLPPLTPTFDSDLIDLSYNLQIKYCYDGKKTELFLKNHYFPLI